jgi:hypothetical protein
MSIELKQAAQDALSALEKSQPHPSNPVIGLTNQDFIDHEETIRQLRTAIQQAEAQQPATGEPVGWPLRARVWKRESTQEWVLEIAGTLGDTEMNIRHTQPLSVAYENVPGLPTIYTHPAPSVPEGYALVPIEPTQAMLKVPTWDFNRFYSPREIWAAMLAAK